MFLKKLNSIKDILDFQRHLTFLFLYNSLYWCLTVLNYFEINYYNVSEKSRPVQSKKKKNLLFWYFDADEEKCIPKNLEKSWVLNLILNFPFGKTSYFIFSNFIFQWKPSHFPRKYKMQFWFFFFSLKTLSFYQKFKVCGKIQPSWIEGSEFTFLS